MYLVKDKNTLSAIADNAVKYDTSPVAAHIITDVLYPAVGNLMLDGTTALSAVTTGPNSSTVASSKYGTVQSDGRMYYFTSVFGSKPIKDPRIGAHFGSQRHKFKSWQILSHETALMGEDIRSVDGREWMRIWGDWVFFNSQSGVGIYMDGATSNHAYMEVTGYFTDVNLLAYVSSSTNRGFVYSIDGAAYSAEQTNYEGVASPLGSRYVDNTSLSKIVTGQTLGIHTLEIRGNAVSDYLETHGIELIIQDITSTATRSKIQIPSQNVVSFGKKFTVDGTPHYDPFNGFTNSADSHSAYVDTATSLGLADAPGSSKSWQEGASSTTTHIRPYNGGRVVKWVDSSGVIKTSVNMMPPNAQNLGTTAAVEITTPSATNTAYKPAFSDDAVDHSLAEVAKTYHWREFGNGGANLGTDQAKSDASMLLAADDISYVMDDGLTHLSGDDVNHTVNDMYAAATKSWYTTFIGTGITLKNTNDGPGTDQHAQNLPYGTHILKVTRAAGGVGAANATYILDGVSLSSQGGLGNYSGINEITFHQPKMPPIPEDAVVIADYMLMADFVPRTGADNATELSKGVRLCSASRDTDFIGAGTPVVLMAYVDVDSFMRHNIYNDNATAGATIVGFGTAFGCHYWRSTNRAANCQIKLNGSNWSYVGDDTYKTDTEFAAGTSVVSKNGSVASNLYGIKNQVLGNYTFGDQKPSGGNYNQHNCWEIANPIHTSSHYQTFETPFLHELVGGDRNMEQTNLVVTADGKTWDEVTRDTRYIGNMVHQAGLDAGQGTQDPSLIFDDRRGQFATVLRPCVQKDFACGYNKDICLRDGQYAIHTKTVSNAASTGGYAGQIWLNGVLLKRGSVGSSGYPDSHMVAVIQLKRGDYIEIRGMWHGNHKLNGYYIERC